MFLQNKYTKWYFSIVNRAIKESRCRTDDYYESHHIQPKSLGGTNCPLNLVYLTPKEHFVCHCLLVRMVEDIKSKHKMACALQYMSNARTTTKHSSRLYAIHRQTVIKVLSARYTGNSNPFFGRTHTDALKKYFSENNPTKREDVKEKMRKPKSYVPPRGPMSEEQKAKISATLTGHRDSDATREKKRKWDKNLGWLNKDGETKMIPLSEASPFLAEGWSLGRGKLPSRTA